MTNDNPAMPLRNRQRQAEWMDEPGADPVELDKALAYIRRANRIMGYTRVVLKQLRKFSAGWDRGKTITILDVGTGSADIPRAILQWADRQRWSVKIVGVDLH